MMRSCSSWDCDASRSQSASPVDGKPATPGNGAHVAFHAGHRNTVDACYKAGIENGGAGDGAPGIRTEYDPHYYAAFLRDPDGNKIEIVTFAAN
jgi:catechol 2,3-dioxygenase-like lactoylglutathione lyase family enzyme